MSSVSKTLTLDFTGCVSNRRCLIWVPDFDTLGPEVDSLWDPPLGFIPLTIL